MKIPAINETIPRQELGRAGATLWLIAIIVIAFLVRFRVGLYQLPSFDGCGYIMHALSIAAGKISTVYWAKGIDHYYQPLYPSAIALIHMFIRDWMKAANFANYILGALLLIPVYLFGAKVYGRTGGIIAASLLVSQPLLVDLSSNPSSEPAFVLAFAFGLYFFHRLIEEKKAGLAALAGLCFGLSYLSRAQAAIFLPISLVTFAWLVMRKKLTLMQSAKFLALVVLGFYVFGLPYDLYCIRKDGSYGLRARQEFFKKVAEPQTNAYYIAERDLDRDAELLASFRAEREMSPFKYVRTHTREYLSQVGVEFRHSASVMVGEGMIINTLIVVCIFLALLAVFLKRPPGKETAKLEPYGLWIFFFIVVPPFTAPTPVRYYVGLLPVFALLGAGGIIFLRELCARAKWSSWLRSQPALGLWLAALLVLYPHARITYLASQKEMDAKQEYQVKVADWLGKVLPEHGKTIMSSLPYAALATGNNWLLLPLDWPMRTIHYAQLSGADYLLAEEYPFAWVMLPADWSDYFTTPLSKPGLKFLASYPPGKDFPEAVLYKIEKPQPEPKKLPNIVFIVLDSLRADHVSANGYALKTTPHMDELAKQGVNFSKVVGASDNGDFRSVALLSSIWFEGAAWRRGLFESQTRGQTAFTFESLAGLLKKRGYQEDIFLGSREMANALGLGSAEQLVIHQNLAALEPEGLDAVFTRVDKLDPAQPFFLMVHTCESCQPFLAPPEYLKQISLSTTPVAMDRKAKTAQTDEQMANELRDFQKQVFADPQKPAPEEIARLSAFYDAEIRYSDEMVGRLVEGLKQRKLLGDNTVVIITSNGGTAFGEHGSLGSLLYDEDVRVPLMMVWPGHFPAGKTVTGQARTLDVIPTLFDYLGLRVPVQCQGASLRPLIETKNDLDLSALSESRAYSGPVASASPASLDQALRAAGWLYYQRGKYIQLFNLPNDPAEKVNLLAPEVFSLLPPEKAKYVKDCRDNFQLSLASWNLFNDKHLRKFSAKR